MVTQRTANPLAPNKINGLLAKYSGTGAEHGLCLQRQWAVDNAAVKLAYLKRDTDRHGTVRYYLRMPGKPTVRMEGDPESERFRRAYWNLRKGLEANDPTILPMRLRCSYAMQAESVAEKVFDGAKKRSYGRQIAFNLHREEALSVLRQQDHRCAVSGLRFQFARQENAVGGRSPYSPSLDRIDNGKGYELGNVRWVLLAVNIALADWGDQQLVDIARAIAAKHRVKP